MLAPMSRLDPSARRVLSALVAVSTFVFLLGCSSHSDSDIQTSDSKGRDVRVALLDSGVARTSTFPCSTVVGATATPSSDHGTEIASVIAELRPDSSSCSPWTDRLTILSIDVSCAGKADHAAIASGIDEALADDAAVINLSVSFGKDYRDIREAVERAIARG